jgi:putative Holliday junction resolvase
MQDFKKYLAIDYGLKRIGLASGGLYPSGQGIIDASKGFDYVSLEIKRIIRDQEIAGLVIGLPTRSGGEKGTLDKEIRDFALSLAKETKLDVYFEDEQFSSTEAERQLLLHNKKIERKSGEVDEMAAILVLEQFINNLKTGERKPDIGGNEG